MNDFKAGEVQTQLLDDMQHINSDQLLLWYASSRKSAAYFQGLLGRLEQEIQQRIRGSGGTMLPSEEFICELVTTNTYDQAAFRPFLEILTGADLETVFIPAHVEQVEVKDKWDTRKLIALARRYGKEALSIIDRARVPGVAKLRFEPRKKE